MGKRNSRSGTRANHIVHPTTIRHSPIASKESTVIATDLRAVTIEEKRTDKRNDCLQKSTQLEKNSEVSKDATSDKEERNDSEKSSEDADIQKEKTKG